ncbi:MAG: cytochrome C oxidase subunit IV family protein [Bacteroidota bacterium]
MSHLSYEDQKKLVMKGLRLLAIVTITEVFLALLFNGHIVSGFHKDHFSTSQWVTMGLVAIYGLAMVGFSLYKAKFIVYNFMHLGSEVSGLRMSILLPMLLLVWAIIAFFQEGGAWKNRRDDVQERNMQERSSYIDQQQLYDEETNTSLI